MSMFRSGSVLFASAVLLLLAVVRDASSSVQATSNIHSDGAGPIEQRIDEESTQGPTDEVSISTAEAAAAATAATTTTKEPGQNLSEDKPAIIGGQNIAGTQGAGSLARIFRSGFLTSSYCSGTLVSNRYVITAASCVVYMVFKKIPLGTYALSVVLGDVFMDRNDGPEQTFFGTGYPHPSYPTTGSKIGRQADPADIAMVLLSGPVFVNAYVYPVALSSVFAYEGLPVYFAGWGSTSPASTAPSNSAKVGYGTVVNPGGCGNRIVDYNRQMCVDGYYQNYQSASVCYGDGGGPVINNVVGQGGITGIITFNMDYQTCDTSARFVAVRVLAYRSWIESYIFSN